MLRKSFKSSYGKVSYLVREGGEPLIFLHGLGGTGNSWIRLDQYLVEDFGLYFLDMLGHGRSEKPHIEYTITVQEDVIDEFIEEQGFKSFSLIGNSYGGWVASRYSVDRREPSHLILEDSAGINRTVGEQEKEQRERFVKMVVGNNSMNTESVIENIVKNNSDPKWKLTEEELKKVKIKTLIIWGKEDIIIPLEYGRRMKELIPGSILVEIERAGHVPHVEQPELIADLLNKFVKTGNLENQKT